MTYEKLTKRKKAPKYLENCRYISLKVIPACGFHRVIKEKGAEWPFPGSKGWSENLLSRDFRGISSPPAAAPVSHGSPDNGSAPFTRYPVSGVLRWSVDQER